MSAPFMQLYVADYLGDTQHLTTEQHGAYLLILMTMWRQGGSLPDDERTLARVARVSPRRWHLIASEILAFFDVSDGKVTQKRLVEEYQKAVSKSEKRSASGKLGGDAKALKNKETDVANAKQMPQHSSEPDIRYQKDNPATPKGVSPPSKRGTRIGGFQPDENVGVELGLSPEQSHREAEKFRDWALSAPGQKGLKLDWPAAWRNWARRAFDDLPKQSSQHRPRLVHASPRPKSVAHRMADKMLGRASPSQDPDEWRTIDAYATRN